MAFAVHLQKLRLAAESTHGNIIFKRAASQCVRFPRSSFVCHMYKRAGSAREAEGPGRGRGRSGVLSCGRARLSQRSRALDH